ncbi:MAG: hypothetical protein HN904_19285, partial [Victivallales bacterium]|nr:hypothetical protein [Victivallales bacterium]
AAANNYQQVDDGDRFRVRVRNGDMVLSKALNVTSITSDTLVIDSLPPQLSLEADINDADADGYLGSVAFIFHEALQPGNEDAGDWTITDADGSSDLSPTLDSQLGLSTDYRTLTLALADSEGTTGKINCRTTYDADALGLLDWAGNPVDFTAAGATSADDVPPLILHSGIVLDAGWSLDGRAVPAVGIHGGLWYHDRNNNGQWDAGEDIWADRPGGTPGQYDDGIDRRVWNGGDAWTTVDGYSQWAKQDGLYCFDANGDTLWNADENIWVDRDTDTLDGEDDLDGMGEYDQNTDERIFVHRGEEVSVVDLDQNGRVDALEVVLSEVVDPSTVPGYSNHWTNFISQTWYLPARTALQVDPNGPLDQAASAMDGRHLYFIFNELAADQYDTGATPDLVTLNARLEDLEGNPLNGGSDYQAGDVTVDDQALPVLVSARGDAAIVGGNILAGTRVTLTFSEQMAAYTELAHADFVTDPDGSGPEPAATAFEQKDATLSIDGQGRVVITFDVDTDGGTWTENLTIGINPGRDDYCVGDTVGHNLAEGGAPVQIRGMGSILVTEVLTLDTDGSGFIDAMRVTFDRNIDDSTLAGYGGADVLIDVADNDDHFRVAGRDGFVFIDPNGPFDNDPTGDNVLYLVFAPEGDIPDTGTTPLLTIADDCSLRSFDNEPVDVSSVPLSTDGAAPQIMDVSAYDQDGDGSVETVRLDFSEPIADGTVVPADYFIGGHAALAMDSIRLRTVTGVDNLDGTFTYTFGTLVRHGLKAGDQINIGGGPYGVASALSLTSFTVVTATDLSAMAGTDAAIVSNDDSAIFLSTAPGDQAPGTAYQTVAYTQNFVLAPPAGDADTADAVGNLLADRADAGLRDRLDYAPPVVLAASSLSDRSLQVSFSEVVTVPTLDTVSVNTLAPIAFDSVDAAANPVLVFAANNATWNTGATGLDGDAASGTDSEGAPEGDIRTDLRFAPAAVRDISTQANPLAGVDFAGTTDGTAPVVIRVATSDMGPDGNVDRAMVTFSEQVQNVLAGQFRLGGVAVETATTVDNYEWTFDVFAADQAPGTAYAQLDYLGGICDDLAGNLLPDSAAGMADLGLVQVDGAGPRLLRVSTVDDRTVQVFFSEPLVNSADEIGVAVTNGEFILQVARAAMQFGEALVDDGTGLLVPTGGQGDLASFLLRMTDGTTWNTDATGADAGVGFDATGNQQAVLPQVHASAGVLQDAAGNPLAAAAFVGTTDGAPPVVVEVTTASSQRNNIFGADDNVFVKAIFSEALAYDVAGGLGARLTLQTGAGPSATANVFSTLLENDDDAGTVVGLDRTLAFTYTVVNGDNRVYSVPGYFEYAATDSLIANGAVIADALGNVADLALPTIAPDGDGNSLSRAKVELDTL